MQGGKIKAKQRKENEKQQKHCEGAWFCFNIKTVGPTVHNHNSRISNQLMMKFNKIVLWAKLFANFWKIVKSGILWDDVRILSFKFWLKIGIDDHAKDGGPKAV